MASEELRKTVGDDNLFFKVFSSVLLCSFRVASASSVPKWTFMSSGKVLSGMMVPSSKAI